MFGVGTMLTVRSIIFWCYSGLFIPRLWRTRFYRRRDYPLKHYETINYIYRKGENYYEAFKKFLPKEEKKTFKFGVDEPSANSPKNEVTCETCKNNLLGPGYEPCASCDDNCGNWEGKE